MNYIAEIAKKFGVELEREFRIKKEGYIMPYLYRFTEKGLLMKDGTNADYELRGLLTGQLSIVRGEDK